MREIRNARDRARRQRRNLPDDVIEQASYRLTDNQFIAWKYATLQGLSNIEISDRMQEVISSKAILPTNVRSLLSGCARRGFPVEGEA